MSYASTVQALEDRLRATWGETDIVAVGERYERPDPPRPFVQFDVEADPARIISFGAGGYHRTMGRVVLSAFVPVDGAGRGLALELAERLAALFPVGDDVGGARLGAPGFGRVLPADGDSGWLVTDLTIPFALDIAYA